jgi:hypothetical protein
MVNRLYLVEYAGDGAALISGKRLLYKIVVLPLRPGVNARCKKKSSKSGCDVEQ